MHGSFAMVAHLDRLARRFPPRILPVLSKYSSEVWPRVKELLACCLIMMPSLGGCRTTTASKVTEVRNGPFKALIRSTEFNKSGIQNIDVCVAYSSARDLPTNEIECVLHGYDFSGLSVNWKSSREIEISFDCGRISQFTNDAILASKESVPVEIHARLIDKCAR